MEKVFFYIWQPCLVFHFWRFYVFPRTWQQLQVFLRFLPSFLALDSRFLFSTVGTSWHWVYVFRLFAHVSCFPRLTAASSFPARFNKFSHACSRFVFATPTTGFIISAVLTSALVYYAAVICLVTQRRCPYSPPKGKEHCRDETSNGFLDTLIRGIGFLWFLFLAGLSSFHFATYSSLVHL